MTDEPEIVQIQKLWPQNKSPYDEKGQCAHPGCTRIFAKDKMGKPYTNRVNEHFVRKHNFKPPLTRRKYKDPEVVEAKQQMKKLRGNYKAKLERYASKGVMRDLKAAILGTKREIEALKKLEKPVAKAKTVLDLDLLMNNAEEVPSLPLLCLGFHSTIMEWREEKAFLEGRGSPDPIPLPTPENIEIYTRKIMFFCHPNSCWSGTFTIRL